MQPTAHLGDCVEVLATMEPETFDSVVCDPPYHLTADKKGGSGDASVNPRSPAGRSMVTTGFMGKQWDGGDVAFRPETWAAIARVMKPGAYLVAFGGTRTSHRMACAIEDAGLEIRDSLLWLYGTGFPKSLDVSKAIDKAAGAEREVVGVAGKSGSARSCMAGDFAGGEYMATAPATEAARQWQGWGTALKPAHENIILARKPLAERTVAANVLKHGVGALNVAACRVSPSSPARAALSSSEQSALSWLGDRLPAGREPLPCSVDDIVSELRSYSICGTSHVRNGRRPGGNPGSAYLAVETLLSRLQTSAVLCDPKWIKALDFLCGCPTCSRSYDEHALAVQVAAQDGLPSLAGALADMCSWPRGRPHSRERQDSDRPSNSGEVDPAAPLLKFLVSLAFREHSTYLARPQGGTPTGRFPPNVLHDGSPEVLEAFARFHAPGQQRVVGPEHGAKTSVNVFGDYGPRSTFKPRGDTGTAARFFPELGFHYSGKATKADRAGSSHPTIKPQSLMRWLCRLVTPPGGHVLDPFAGSGSTLQAAHREGFRATGIELTPEHFEDIQRRLRLLEAFDDGLFAGMEECA